MITREVTTADRRPLTAFLRREFEALGYTGHRMTLANVNKLIARGVRWRILIEDDTISAAVGSEPYDTTEGKGYTVTHLVVAKGHPDKLLALDALALFAINRPQSDGVKFIRATIPRPDAADYARDHSGMAASQPLTGEQNILLGSPQDILRAILARRPEWRTSLSSMTLT